MAVQVPAAVLALLRQLAELDVGYPVDLLTHSLQTATRAVQANATDDLVLAALLHDVGFALVVEGHAEISAAILRGYVDENAYRVVRHHTELEWQHYGALIGQPTDQRARYIGQPWFADAERFVDEWEIASYEPGFAAMALEDFEDLVRARFGDGSLIHDQTASDCIA
jgi:predicted HD phosphohydrolase